MQHVLTLLPWEINETCSLVGLERGTGCSHNQSAE